jgi:Subtilase family
MMLDNSNQSESLIKLHYNPLTNRLSGLDIPDSTVLGNQHRHPSSRFVLPGIISKESPFLTALQIKTADLDLNNIFHGDRHVQVHSGKEYFNQHLSFHQDGLTGKMADAQLVGTIVGIIDTGFSAKDPQVTHASLQLGRDRVDGDANPLVKAGNQHGTGVLNVIAAKDGNAPLWLGRAVGSGKWADSLVEFVDSAKTSGRSHAVVNLSFDLTQVNSDGSITTRQQLTSQERGALNYARQNGVLIVAAAGNTGNEMSALGRASQEFDNIITVGAAKGLDRANYSSYGSGLTLLAHGSLQKNGKENEKGTSIATAEVTAAVSQVWAANSKLGYRQVIDILKATATDLNTLGQDIETGAGLLNQTKAIHLATLTTPVLDTPVATASPVFTSQTVDHTALERPALFGVHIPTPSDVVHAVKNAVEKGVGVAKDAVNGAVGAGHEVVGITQNVGSAIVNDVIHALNPLLDPIVDVTQNVGSDVINNVIHALNPLLDPIVDVTQNVGSDVINNVIHALNPLLDPIVNGAVDQGATIVSTVGNGISTGINLGTDIAKNVVTEKITGILQQEIYKVQAFPDRLKRLGQDLAKNPTKGFGKWIGRVSIDLAETLGIPEDAETIAALIKPETRSLTPDEIKLAKSVFGNSINYRLVKLDEAAKTVDWAKQLKGFNAPRPFTTFHTINSWGKLEKETLIHELTHIWQYEHGGAKYIPEALAVNGKSSGYDYKGVSNLRKLQAARKGMSSFNPEQQAKIVEEYFLIKTGQASKANFSGGATSKDLPTYAHFVKEVSTLSEKKLD